MNLIAQVIFTTLLISPVTLLSMNNSEHEIDLTSNEEISIIKSFFNTFDPIPSNQACGEKEANTEKSTPFISRLLENETFSDDITTGLIVAVALNKPDWVDFLLSPKETWSFSFFSHKDQYNYTFKIEDERLQKKIRSNQEALLKFKDIMLHAFVNDESFNLERTSLNLINSPVFYDGNTAFCHALMYKKTNVSEWLFYNKANFNIKNYSGKTALDYDTENLTNNIRRQNAYKYYVHLDMSYIKELCIDQN